MLRANAIPLQYRPCLQFAADAAIAILKFDCKTIVTRAREWTALTHCAVLQTIREGSGMEVLTREALGLRNGRCLSPGQTTVMDLLARTQ